MVDALRRRMKKITTRKKIERVSHDHPTEVFLRAYNLNAEKIFEARGVVYIDYSRNLIAVEKRISIYIEQMVFISVVRLQRLTGEDLLVWTPNTTAIGEFGVGPYVGAFATGTN